MKIQFRMKTDSDLNELLDDNTPFHFEGVDPDNVDGEEVREALHNAIRKSGMSVHPGDSFHVVAVDEPMDNLD